MYKLELIMKKLLKYISILLFASFLSCENGNKSKEIQVAMMEIKAKNKLLDSLKPIEKNALRELKSKYKIYSIGHTDIFKKIKTDTTCVIGKNNYTAVKKGYILFNKDTIRLESEIYLEKTFVTENDKNIYIFYTFEEYDSGSSRALCVDKKTLKINWNHSIGGFNLSKPIMDNDVVYIASLDHLSKLSLKTGKFYWRLDNLYQKYKINYVEKMIFKEKSILYLYKKQHPSKELDTLCVNDLSGKITRNLKYFPCP